MASGKRKALKEAVLGIKKFYEELLLRVGEDEAKKLERVAKEYEAILVSTVKHKQLKKEAIKQKLTWEFDSRDELDDLIEGLIESFCRGCKKRPIKDCGIRKMFMKHDIEPMNYFARPGECQFKYPEED